MRTRQQIYLLIVATTAATACVGPEPEPHERPSTPKDLSPAVSERMRISASGRYLASSTTSLAPSAPPSMDSLDIPVELSPTFLSIARPLPDLAADPANVGPASDRTEYGIITPTKGTSFLVLGTGRSGGIATALAEPGLDFPPTGEAGDVVTFRFQVTIPPEFAHLNRLSFDYNFLSAEAPEYVGSDFNDTFTARVSDVIGSNRTVASASINSSTFHLIAETAVGGGSPFLLLATDPSGIDLPPYNGTKPDAGSTGFQRVDVPFDSGATGGVVAIEFDIRDIGDGLVDSVVIIDNVEFSAIEMIDPNTGNPASDLIDDSGKIYRAPALISTQGTPVHAVAADGVTQTILRSRVPAAGEVTFSLPAAEFPLQGRLSENEDVLDWADSVTVSTVLVGGKHYAFALYQSPADFNREDVDGDELLKRRTAPLTMTYTPTPPTTAVSFEQPFTIGIERPAVVVVPEIWSSCGLWREGYSLGAEVDPTIAPDDPRLAFTVTCADYERTSSHGLAANNHVVQTYIHQALQQQRGPGVAATQVDVIGHGVGGLLVRRYIDDGNFIRPHNFNEGSINRLITMNTPHLGSRMADEIVRFRNFLKINASDAVYKETIRKLDAQGIRIENEAGDRMIDDITSQSSMINRIGKSNVRSHVMYTTSGRSIPRDIAMAATAAGGLSLKLKALYTYLERQHPKVRNLADASPDREKLLFGSESYLFCGHPSTPPASSSDDHDLFLTQAEQLGGLSLADPEDLAMTSQFNVEYAGDVESNYTEHFFVSNGIAHLIRLAELLNLPVSSETFGDSLQSPAGIDREHSCPLTFPLAPLAPQLPVHSLTAGSITILPPAGGTTVAPGSNVTVVVQPSGGFQPGAVLIMGPDSSQLVKQPPFKAVLRIPDKAIGAVSLEAVAFSGPDMAFANLPLNVNVSATLTSLEVLNGDVVLQRPGDTRQLRVFGDYSDQFQRDITAPALGTQYDASSLTDSAAVSPSGLITALAPGFATIVVRNGTAITSIKVTVGEAACGDGVRDPGEACDDGNLTSGDGCSSACLGENRPPAAVCQSPTACNDAGLCSANVTLGGGSSDPDGDPISITQSPAGPYAVGPHAVSVSVFDGEVGAQCVAHLEVQDCEPPSLSCPANFEAECTGGGGAQITSPSATASDNCSVTVNAPADGQLPLGSTELAYSASDPSGNGASCTTTVTVQDTIAPSITCPPLVTAECTGAGQASVDPGVAATSDVCTPVSVTNPSHGPYPLGTTPVIFTASDTSGNQASCTSTVKVVDTTPPQLSLTPPAPLWPLDHLYRTISLADCHPVVQDSCGGVLAPSTYQAAITCVTSDEPDNTAGSHDGNTVKDILIVSATTVKLRAERHSSFDGRVYKIHFRVKDGAGNLTNGVCPVVVPYYECKPEDEGDCQFGDSGVANSVCQ